MCWGLRLNALIARQIDCERVCVPRLDHALTRVAGTGGRLSKNLLTGGFALRQSRVDGHWARIGDRVNRVVLDRQARLASSVRVLRAVSYQNVLKRGFALVRDRDGGLLRRASEASSAKGGEIQFVDGVRGFSFSDDLLPAPGGGRAEQKPLKTTASPTATGEASSGKAPDKGSGKPRQQGLFD